MVEKTQRHFFGANSEKVRLLLNDFYPPLKDWLLNLTELSKTNSLVNPNLIILILHSKIQSYEKGTKVGLSDESTHIQDSFDLSNEPLSSDRKARDLLNEISEIMGDKRDVTAAEVFDFLSNLAMNEAEQEGWKSQYFLKYIWLWAWLHRSCRISEWVDNSLSRTTGIRNRRR